MAVTTLAWFSRSASLTSPSRQLHSLRSNLWPLLMWSRQKRSPRKRRRKKPLRKRPLRALAQQRKPHQRKPRRKKRQQKRLQRPEQRQPRSRRQRKPLPQSVHQPTRFQLKRPPRKKQGVGGADSGRLRRLRSPSTSAR